VIELTTQRGGECHEEDGQKEEKKAVDESWKVRNQEGEDAMTTYGCQSYEVYIGISQQSLVPRNVVTPIGY
jgi:hypothetical protein